MLALCGISLSNYYNKVKLVLLEKGVPFTEEVVKTGGSGEALLAATPLAKSRSSAPSTAACAKARRSSTTSRPRTRPRRCCRPTRGRPRRCAS